MANFESEVKVDIEDLLLPPNHMEDFEIKEEPLENGETNPNSNYGENKSFKSKMEEEILSCDMICSSDLCRQCMDLNYLLGFY